MASMLEILEDPLTKGILDSYLYEGKDNTPCVKSHWPFYSCFVPHN